MLYYVVVQMHHMSDIVSKSVCRYSDILDVLQCNYCVITPAFV